LEEHEEVLRLLVSRESRDCAGVDIVPGASESIVGVGRGLWVLVVVLLAIRGGGGGDL
jgi:hypothetical protein